MSVTAVLLALGLLALLGAASAGLTLWARRRSSPLLAIILWLALSLATAALWLVRARSVQEAAGFDVERVLGPAGFAVMASFVGICLGLSSRLAWSLSKDPNIVRQAVLLKGARHALLGAGVCLAVVVLLDLTGVVR